jgi:hypothetical protein
MICHRRTFLALAGSVAFAGSALAAKHEHHDGVQLLGSRIGTDGRHEIHRIGDHGVTVHVQGKKVLRVTVEHRTKGEMPVKKYKSSKKMVQGDVLDQMAGAMAGDLVRPAGYRIAQAVTYVGYSFIDPLTGTEQIYWYPAYMVVDPLTGAVDYVPVA